MTNDAKGMKGIRARNNSGELRRKRNDTHISSLEQQYQIDLGVRSDMHLKTLLEKNKVGSLKQLISKE